MPRRRFPPSVYKTIMERQNYRCACGCGEKLEAGGYHFDHELPLWAGGEDVPENLRALKTRHHIQKTSKEAKDRAKADRIRQKNGLGPQPHRSKRQRDLDRYLGLEDGNR